MNPFEKAKKLFSKNQFAAAANSYYEALSEDVLSYQLKVDCYQKILKICQFTKTKFDPIEIKKELAAFYMQNKQWSRAVDEYSKIIPASRNGATLENYWTCLHQDGQIKMANECLVDLLEYLLKRKNIRFCLEVLKSAEEREAPTKIISTYKVKAFVIQGNKAQVDTELEGVLSDSMLGIKNHSGAIYRHLEEVVLLERNYWKTTRAIQEVKLQGLVNDFKRGNVSKSKSLQNRKEFIKSIYDYILNFDENVGTLGLIVKYAQFFERKELGEKALALLEEGHKLRDFRNKSFNIIKIKEYLSTLEESKRFETEDFDLGTDLFSDLSDESEEDLKIRKLERDIAFLLEHDQKDKAFNVMQELNELKPHHKFEKEYHDMLNRESGSAFSPKNQTKEEIEENLLREINLYSSNLGGGAELDPAYDEMNILKMLEYLGPDVLEKNYNDLVVSMITMQFYKPAKLIIDIINRKSSLKKVKERVNILYLKAVVAFEEEDFFKVIEEVDNALADLPLLLEEKKCLIYLKGEAYLKKKNIREALICFRAVEEVDPNYRLVKYKLRNIEQSK